MIGYGTFAVADGCTAAENLTLCCLLNGSTGGFFASKFCDNQSFTIQSANPPSAEGICEIPAGKVEYGTVFSVKPNPATESVVSVTAAASTLYTVSKYISDTLSITIDVFVKAAVKVCRYIRRRLTNMKGRRNRTMVYTLCLLRL